MLQHRAGARRRRCWRSRRTRRSLFGKRLWAETRIALFQQSVDSRATRTHLRETRGARQLRHALGDEVGRRDLQGGHRALPRARRHGSRRRPDGGARRGEIPQLKALRLHNGTIYRWNRACYGITERQAAPPDREPRAARGPDVARRGRERGVLVRPDGRARRARTRTSRARIDFDQAAANFYTAAREGSARTSAWLDGKRSRRAKLVLERLLPLAEAGLRRQGIDDADIKKYLGVVEERVRTARTGARWQLSSWNSLPRSARRPASARPRSSPRPCSASSPAARSPSGSARGSTRRTRRKGNYARVEHYMTTDLFTVHAEDPIEMVANLMIWERIRHVPVEDSRPPARRPRHPPRGAALRAERSARRCGPRSPRS